MDATRSFVGDIGAIIAEMVERSPGIIFDHFQIRAGETLPFSARLFAVPVGHPDGRGSYRTIVETNMLSGYMLPPPRCIVVQRVGFLVPRDQALSRLPLGHWSLEVDDKSRADGPLVLDSGWGISDPEKPEETAKDMREVGPLYIAPLQYFYVGLQFADGGKVLSEDLDFWAVLEGIIDKAVS